MGDERTLSVFVPVLMCVFVFFCVCREFGTGSRPVLELANQFTHQVCLLAPCVCGMLGHLYCAGSEIWVVVPIAAVALDDMYEMFHRWQEKQHSTCSTFFHAKRRRWS